MEIYIVELQSLYDGGGSTAVFSSLEKARAFIEKQNDFKSWDKDEINQSIRDSGDFFYVVNQITLDKE